MFTYLYTKSPINQPRLLLEIQASTISLPVVSIYEIDGLITISFDGELSDLEVQILNLIVFKHANDPGIMMNKFSTSFIQDLKLTYISEDQISIGTGKCKDSANLVDLINEIDSVPVKLSQSLDNGLDTGKEESLTWYFVWLIAKEYDTLRGTATSTSEGMLVDLSANFSRSGVRVGHAVYNITNNVWAKVTSVDDATQLTLDADIFSEGQEYIIGPKVVGLLSKSPTSPLLPDGYLYKRRIGSIRNNDGDIISFTQTGKGSRRIIFFNSLMPVLEGGSATEWTEVDVSPFVPVTSESINLITNGMHVDVPVASYIMARPKGFKEDIGQAMLYVEATEEYLPAAPAQLEMAVVDLAVEYKVLDNESLRQTISIISYIEEL